eukprot:363941-Chlamydomonas_euryale.AAC.14
MRWADPQEGFSIFTVPGQANGLSNLQGPFFRLLGCSDREGSCKANLIGWQALSQCASPTGPHWNTLRQCSKRMPEACCRAMISAEGRANGGKAWTAAR